MELLADFSHKEGRLNIREFFLRCSSDIDLHHTQITLDSDSWQSLKDYWIKTIDRFKATNPSIKMVNNAYKVDWEELYNTRMIKMSRKRIRATVAETFRDATNDSLEESSSSLFSGEPTISNITIRSEIKDAKAKLKHEPTLSKKDLLYYDIIDFVSKNKNNATMLALGEHYNRFKDERRRKLKRNKVIAMITNKIFDKHPNLPLKQILKKAKQDLRQNVHAEDRILTKRVIKALKVYQHLFEEETRQFSEDEYLYLLIRPLLKIALKDNDNISLVCGETSLRCSAKRLNKKRHDEERRGSGPSIDIIFKDVENKQELGIMELSGPINKTHHTHFLEDRNKIAINLKYMLKTLIKSVPPCSLPYIQSLKLYSYQVHDGTFYIYSIHTYDQDHYIFNLEYEFAVPLTQNALEPNCSTFFSKLWILTDLFTEVNENIKQLLRLHVNSAC
ncbi:hypothetical protein MBANPS3_002306 [Mucor bainieri]